jgi:aryl sulfotransferase
MSIAIDSLKPYRSAVFDSRRWRDFEPREDDIVVCTPPKCGTTWTQTIVASLLWPDGDFPRPILEMSPWIDCEIDPIDRILARLRAQQHRRFIKTHTPLDGIPLTAELKYVCVARDGRDAFMSMCNHLERFRDDVRDGLNARVEGEGIPMMLPWTGDVHAFFPVWLMKLGLLEHAATFWEHRRDPNVLLVHYNDLKADLGAEMSRIAEFLGIDVPAAKWPAVVGRCTFESMQAHGSTLGEIERLFEGGTRSFIFKGTNGRWRDVLTAEELASYAGRVAELLPPDAAGWLEGGRSAIEPRSA